MQQRQLRLGDILDDYCPRERRITNHAVVAMIGEDVKQTRCTTCEAEHDYRHGKVPPQRKKKEAPGALFKQVLDGQKIEGIIPQTPAAGIVVPPAPTQRRETPPPPPSEPEPEPVAAAEASSEPREDEGPVHRPLIRATLPRPEGQTPTRPAPDFTLRQPTGRPGRFRPGGPRGNQRTNRPMGFSQPQGSGQKAHGMRHGPPNRHGDRPGPMSNRPGNRPHQHRSPNHPMNPQGRSGKKRHR
jgi:hypothetical protein